jgi:hypothetical protein
VARAATPNEPASGREATLVRRWRRLLLVVAALIAAFLAFAGWYRIHYSMSIARAFEVNDPRSAPRILIATQGSEFKDAVVAAVVKRLRTRAAYVKVVDVSALASLDDAAWHAIVILHTWEMRKPPAPVQAFVDRARGSGKLVVLTTSGGGDFRIEGVDAISSASVVADAQSRSEEILARLDAILSRNSAL